MGKAEKEVMQRIPNGKPVLEYKPHRHSGAGVNALHEKLRISEETARGILMRLQEGGFLKEAQPDLKDPLHNLFFCFPHPIKSTSYKREFVGNWGYAEAP